MRDSVGVVLDLEEGDPVRRYKLFRYYYDSRRKWFQSVYFSQDGIHWSEATRPKPVRGDRNTVFYNPLRKVWVYNEEIGEQSAMVAGFLGVLKDALGQAPDGAGTVEAPIAAHSQFEHLEADGQRLLPEQLKTMLKALARSNLLRDEAG